MILGIQSQFQDSLLAVIYQANAISRAIHNEISEHLGSEYLNRDPFLPLLITLERILNSCNVPQLEIKIQGVGGGADYEIPARPFLVVNVGNGYDTSTPVAIELTTAGVQLSSPTDFATPYGLGISYIWEVPEILYPAIAANAALGGVSSKALFSLGLVQHTRETLYCAIVQRGTPQNLTAVEG